jgi:tetratricopeptide (TPR) repeat protein
VRGLPLALFAGVTLVYAPALRHGFVYDDFEVILAQPAPRSAGDLARVFAEPHGLPLSKLPYYRPVTRASLLLQKAWHGDAPALFHLGNALLAGVAALAAYVFLRRDAFGLPAIAAALGAAAFAVHPVASSVVYPIASGRETLVPAIGFVAAAAAHLQGGVWARVGAAACFALALLAKEQAIAFPLVALAADALRLGRDPPGRDPWAWLLRHAPYAAIVVAYLALRAAVFPASGSEAGVLPLVGATLAARPLGPFEALGYALQVVLVPFAGLRYEPELRDWLSHPRLAVALAIGAGLALALSRGGPGERRAALFLALWVPLCMLATLGLLPIEVRFDERFVFLSALGLVGLVTMVAARAARLRPRGALAGGAAVVALLAGMTLWRGSAYTDPVAFGRRWVATSPEHANARFTLGTALARSGDLEAAVPELEHAVALAPALEAAHYNLAVALARLGRDAEAVRHLEQALALFPANPDGHYALGVLLEAAGRAPEARGHYREALRLRPGWDEPAERLARP